MTIGVTGATGQLGRLVLANLVNRQGPSNLVALARTPAKAADLGVVVREADYDRPDTLSRALEGIDTLLLISSSEVGKRGAQHKAVIEAARAAGVSHLVYTSLLHADRSPLSLASEHRETEAMLADSGIAVTLLRNGWYSENYLGALPTALKTGAFVGAAGDGKIASAARRDYAEAAAVVLTTGDHQGKTYELAGDTAYTLSDLAAEVTRQAGKTVTYKTLSEDDYAQILVGAGLPVDLAHSIAQWDVGASHGGLFDDSKTLSSLIGHPTTSLAESVKVALSALK